MQLINIGYRIAKTLMQDSENLTFRILQLKVGQNVKYYIESNTS